MKKKWPVTIILLGSILTIVYTWNQKKSFKAGTLFDSRDVTRSPASKTIFPIRRQAHIHSKLKKDVTKTKDEIKSLEQITTSLIQLKKSYQAAKPEQKEKLKNQIITQAKQRNEQLLSLAKTNPQDVIKMAIPTEKRKDFPKEALALIESPIKVEGKVESLYEDYQDGSNKLRQFLKIEKKNPYELHFAQISTNLPIDKKVQASGIFIPDARADQVQGHIALESQEKNMITLAAGGTGGPQDIGSIVLAAPATVGQKSLLVLLVNFQNDPTNKPWTIDQINQLAFKDTNDFFQENSFGQTSITGETAGYFTLSTPSTSCSYYDMASEAKSLAEQSGVVVSSYSFTMLIFPKNSACTWSGLGTIGTGYGGVTWLNGYATAYLFGHELGHNFGLYHAHSLDCLDTIVTDGNIGCYSINYGDIYDIMGNGSGHYNAFFKQRLHWFDASPDASLFSIQESGTYTMGIHALPTAQNPAALKVLRNSDEATGDKVWYYMEYRHPSGFDSYLAGDVNVTDGILIHTGNDIDRNSSHLLDMTPNSDTWYDFKDSSLRVGQTYIDETAGVEITLDEVTDTNATVTVTLGPKPCVARAPSMTIETSQSIWAPAGDSAQYQLKLTNNDSATCDPSIIALSTSNPTGWTADLSQIDAQLSPGQSVFFTAIVTSLDTAVDGFYTINVLAQHAELSDSVDLTYIVDSPVIVVNSPPVAVDDSATTKELQAVTIDVLANDSDPDGDALNVASATNVNGSPVINADGSITFTPASGFFGVTSFDYTIEDGRGGAASAKVTVIVNELPDTTAPTVSITDPMDGSIVSSGQVLSIAAIAQDNKSIARVDFYVNGSLIASDNSNPYTSSHTIPQKGKDKVFNIEARAFDTTGLQSSATITVRKDSSTSTSRSGKGKK